MKLPVTHGYIVSRAKAADIFRGIFRGDISRLLPDDEAHLRLPVDGAADPRNIHRMTRPDDASGHLREHYGALGNRLPGFLGVVPIVEHDRQPLARTWYRGL